MKPFGYIYRVTNAVTFSQYVGQTVKRPEVRWRNHISQSAKLQTRIGKAIRGFGPEVFSLEVLYAAFDRAELNRAEKHFIAEANSVYNIAAGGAGAYRVPPTEHEREQRRLRMKARWANPDTREKMLSFAALGRAVKAEKVIPRPKMSRALVGPRLPKVRTPREVQNAQEATARSWSNPATRASRIEGLKQYWRSPKKASRKLNVPKLSLEVIAAIARAKHKPVYCEELQVSFLSQKHAALFFGVGHSTIAEAVKHNRRLRSGHTLVRVDTWT